MMANGNNMRFADDMTRRTIVSLIDPKMERPEEREIGWNAESEARRNRGKYVSACLTIMLAYRAAGRPRQTTPLGSFETWSRSVRDAIIWAGLPDPRANADKLRDADPELARLAPQTDKTCILPITIAEDLAPSLTHDQTTVNRQLSSSSCF
jgi:putative DNA primase/helicase